MLGRRAFVATGLASMLIAMQGRTARAGTPKFKQTRDSCDACRSACEKAAEHCAARVAEGNEAYRVVQYACEDCSSICSAVSEVVARQETREGRGSIGNICLSSGNVCNATAEECRKIPGDPVLEVCAEACIQARGRLQVLILGC
jgi:hypothetical protein